MDTITAHAQRISAPPLAVMTPQRNSSCLSVAPRSLPSLSSTTERPTPCPSDADGTTIRAFYHIPNTHYPDRFILVGIHLCPRRADSRCRIKVSSTTVKLSLGLREVLSRILPSFKPLVGGYLSADAIKRACSISVPDPASIGHTVVLASRNKNTSIYTHGGPMLRTARLLTQKPL